MGENMVISRAIAFGILISPLLLSTIILLNEFVELAENSTPSDDLASKIEDQLEKIEGRSITIEEWENFANLTVDGLEYHYFYVKRFCANFSNIGGLSYEIKDLKKSDLFIIFSSNVGTDSDPVLKRDFLRVPYREDCESIVAPCWRVRKISTLRAPDDVNIEEIINPFDISSTEGLWDHDEMMKIEIQLPETIKFTLAQIYNETDLIGGDGWIYVVLVTPEGFVSKPINIFGKTWIVEGALNEN